MLPGYSCRLLPPCWNTLPCPLCFHSALHSPLWESRLWCILIIQPRLSPVITCWFPGSVRLQMKCGSYWSDPILTSCFRGNQEFPELTKLVNFQRPLDLIIRDLHSTSYIQNTKMCPGSLLNCLRDGLYLSLNPGVNGRTSPSSSHQPLK